MNDYLTALVVLCLKYGCKILINIYQVTSLNLKEFVTKNG